MSSYIRRICKYIRGWNCNPPIKKPTPPPEPVVLTGSLEIVINNITDEVIVNNKEAKRLRGIKDHNCDL